MGGVGPVALGFVGAGVQVDARTRGEHRTVVCSTSGENKEGGWKKVAAVVVAGFSLLGRPDPSAAVRGGGSMFRMTESAAEFVLPSEREAKKREEQRGQGMEMVKGAVGAGVKVAPYVVAGAAVIGGGYFGIKRLQENQVKKFQRDLQSMSSSFGDVEFSPIKRQREARPDTAEIAKNILEKSKTKYKFRERKPARDRSAQVNLDIFKDDSPSSSEELPVSSPSITSPLEAVSGVETEEVKVDPEAGKATKATPENPFEAAIQSYLDGKGNFESVKTAAESLELSDKDAAAAITKFCSVDVIASVDAIVEKLLGMLNGSTTLPPLDEVNGLAKLVSKARSLTLDGFGQDVSLRYTGTKMNQDIAEEIYRVFTVSVLSRGATQDAAQLRELEDLQDVLGIDAEKATGMYEEVVKAMMEEAMSQANLDPQAKDMLDKLRTSFNEGTGGGTGDMNQDVMQMMYALQQLMNEQGISEEEAREMRKLMKEMGIDVRELLSNAEMLVNVLGPEARPLIESLKKILAEEEVTEVKATSVDDSLGNPLPPSAS